MNSYDIHIYPYGTLTVRAFKDKEIWFVANDIADALGYKTSGFSFLPEETRRKFSIYAPKEQRGFLCINLQGMYQILEHSRSKKINEFHKWFYDVVGGNTRSTSKAKVMLKDGLMQNALVILQTAGVTGEKAALTLDKIFKSCTGKSVLELAGIKIEEE